MTWFASDRERNLWAWTLVVYVGILSTLGFARSLAGELRQRDLLDAAFFGGMALIAIAVVALAFRFRLRGMEIGIGLAVFAVYVLLFLRMAVPEERSHLIEYSVIGLLIYSALLERCSAGREVGHPALLAVTIGALAGLVDEIVQAGLPDRVFDWRDVLFNLVAVSLAVGVTSVLLAVRRRRSSAVSDD